MKLLLKAAVTQQSYIKKITNSVKNEMLLTPTVTQGGYITRNRTTAVATLSDSDTKELLQQKRTTVVATLINTKTTELLRQKMNSGA